MKITKYDNYNNESSGTYILKGILGGRIITDLEKGGYAEQKIFSTVQRILWGIALFSNPIGLIYTFRAAWILWKTEEPNDLPVKEKTLNILLLGTSGSGKTTLMDVLENPFTVARPSSFWHKKEDPPIRVVQISDFKLNFLERNLWTDNLSEEYLKTVDRVIVTTPSNTRGFIENERERLENIFSKIPHAEPIICVITSAEKFTIERCEKEDQLFSKTENNIFNSLQFSGAVPSVFLVDEASVRQILNNIYSRRKELIKQAILHDLTDEEKVQLKNWFKKDHDSMLRSVMNQFHPGQGIEEEGTDEF